MLVEIAEIGSQLLVLISVEVMIVNSWFIRGSYVTYYAQFLIMLSSNEELLDILV